jgi:glycosyltransferase involved in cell wall biosynthesis
MVTTINPNMYKGVEIILETAAILKNKTGLKFEWSVVGVSPESQLVNMFEKLKGIKAAENNIVLKGRKGGSEVIAELLNADVFIHPSHIDNSPNSVCEAMLLGMPVIAGNVGGVPSLLRHNENGILYNSYDPFELAGIILEKAGDRAGLNALGANARIFALKRHNPEAIISTILSTYRKVMGERLVPAAGV